jgi:transcription elongation factor Elf1
LSGDAALDEPIDIYSKWLDKIEEENARLGEEEERANKTRRFDWRETGQMRG